MTTDQTREERLEAALWACKSGLIPLLSHPYRTCNPGYDDWCFACTALAHFFEPNGVMYEQQLAVAAQATDGGMRR